MPPPMLSAGPGGPPPLMPQPDDDPVPAPPTMVAGGRWSGVLTTLVTVFVGGGIIAGVVYALLPSPRQRPIAAVEPTSAPEFAGRQAGSAASPAVQPQPADGHSFAAFQAAIEGASHLPLESLDGGNPAGHEATLCDVGDLDVALALPSMRTAERPSFEISCVPDAAVGRNWSVMLEQPGREPMRIGGVRVYQGRLIAELERGTPATMLGRQAVSSAVLRISDSHDAGAATFVQLRRPERHGPLRAGRLLAASALPHDRPTPLGEWIDRCSGLLAGRDGYRRWARGQADRVAARPAAAREYLTWLQPAIAAGEADEEEVALAAALDDLDRLGADQRVAIALLRAVEDGDASFTGSLFVDFPDFVPGHGARCVLATFTAAADAPDEQLP
jgi:hypothetical protein